MLIEYTHCVQYVRKFTFFEQEKVKNSNLHCNLREKIATIFIHGKVPYFHKQPTIRGKGKSRVSIGQSDHHSVNRIYIVYLCKYNNQFIYVYLKRMRAIPTADGLEQEQSNEANGYDCNCRLAV